MILVDTFESTLLDPSSTTIVKLKNADGILNYFRSLWAKLFYVRTVLENDVKESVSGVDIIIELLLRTHTTEMSTIRQ